jgi:hypothetical protein
MLFRKINAVYCETHKKPINTVRHHNEKKAIALVIEAASTSETSVNFYQETRRNKPEDGHLHTIM